MTTAKRRPENAKDNKCNKDNRRTDGRKEGRKREQREGVQRNGYSSENLDIKRRALPWYITELAS